MLYRTGCLVIFFTNFLALMIEANVTESDSNDATVYSIVLIIVHILFGLSIWGNTLATIMATFSKKHVQGVTFGVDIVDEGDIDVMVTKMHQRRSVGRRRASEEVKLEDPEGASSWEGDLSVTEISTDTKDSGTLMSTTAAQESPNP
ncbi:unnamed protein product [Ascophyllum nodosum]